MFTIKSPHGEEVLKLMNRHISSEATEITEKGENSGKNFLPVVFSILSVLQPASSLSAAVLSTTTDISYILVRVSLIIWLISLPGSQKLTHMYDSVGQGGRSNASRQMPSIKRLCVSRHLDKGCQGSPTWTCSSVPSSGVHRYRTLPLPRLYQLFSVWPEACTH